MTLSRRRFLALLPMPLGAVVFVACGGDDEPETSAPAVTSTTTSAGGQGGAIATSTSSGATNTAQLAPTPACADPDDPTPAQTEGPYFTPNSPQRTSLVESGMAGTRLVLEGFVVTRSCRPVMRALVDFWQADDGGNYDNSGYRLRGHQFTDDAGRFRLETIVPGLYPGRTRHIHVKVQAPNQSILTTQLYFPNEARNQSDGIFSSNLVLENSRDASGAKAANFDFVLNLA